MNTQDPRDPQAPGGKPHGTTEDQINEMESEGQAQPPSQPGDSEPATGGDGDQDIDTAGTEAGDDGSFDQRAADAVQDTQNY